MAEVEVVGWEVICFLENCSACGLGWRGDLCTEYAEGGVQGWDAGGAGGEI